MKRLQRYFRAGHIGMTPALSWSDLTAGATAAAVFPVDLTQARRRYTYNGSAAIHAALQDMKLEQGARVLLPAYSCGAELGPFEQLGCEMFFYDIDTDFRVRKDQVEQVLKTQPELRVMLLTHYLGVAQPDVEAIAEQCRLHQVCMIEDCAHALYAEQDGRAVGQSGDYAVFSMRKSLPLSEGGALVGCKELRDASQFDRKPLSVMAIMSRLAYSFQQGARSGQDRTSSKLSRYLTLAAWSLPAMLSKGVRLAGLIPASRWLTPDVEGAEAYPVFGQGISTFSRRLLESTSGADVRRQRRANHARWVNLVNDLEAVGIVHRDLPDGACPLYFLVKVEDPGNCVTQLAQLDIEAFNWWQHMSPQIHWPDFPVARQFKQTLLALPLHQQLQEADLVHMAHCLSLVVGAGKHQP